MASVSPSYTSLGESDRSSNTRSTQSRRPRRFGAAYAFFSTSRGYQPLILRTPVFLFLLIFICVLIGVVEYACRTLPTGDGPKQASPRQKRAVAPPLPPSSPLSSLRSFYPGGGGDDSASLFARSGPLRGRLYRHHRRDALANVTSTTPLSVANALSSTPVISLSSLSADTAAGATTNAAKGVASQSAVTAAVSASPVTAASSSSAPTTSQHSLAASSGVQTSRDSSTASSPPLSTSLDSAQTPPTSSPQAASGSANGSPQAWQVSASAVASSASLSTRSDQTTVASYRPSGKEEPTAQAAGLPESRYLKPEVRASGAASSPTAAVSADAPPSTSGPTSQPSSASAVTGGTSGAQPSSSPPVASLHTPESYLVSSVKTLGTSAVPETQSKSPPASAFLDTKIKTASPEPSKTTDSSSSPTLITTDISVFNTLSAPTPLVTIHSSTSDETDGSAASTRSINPAALNGLISSKWAGRDRPYVGPASDFLNPGISSFLQPIVSSPPQSDAPTITTTPYSGGYLGPSIKTSSPGSSQTDSPSSPTLITTDVNFFNVPSSPTPPSFIYTYSSGGVSGSADSAQSTDTAAHPHPMSTPVTGTEPPKMDQTTGFLNPTVSSVATLDAPTTRYLSYLSTFISAYLQPAITTMASRSFESSDTPSPLVTTDAGMLISSLFDTITPVTPSPSTAPLYIGATRPVSTPAPSEYLHPSVVSPATSDPTLPPMPPPDPSAYLNPTVTATKNPDAYLGASIETPASPGSKTTEPLTLPVLFTISGGFLNPPTDAAPTASGQTYSTPPTDAYLRSSMSMVPSAYLNPTLTTTKNSDAYLGASIETPASPGPKTTEPPSLPVLFTISGGFLNPPTDAAPTASYRTHSFADPSDYLNPRLTTTKNSDAYLGPSIETSASPGPKTTEPSSLPVLITIDGDFLNPPTDAYLRPSIRTSVPSSYLNPTLTTTKNSDAYLGPSIETSASPGPKTTEPLSLPVLITIGGSFFNPPTDAAPTASDRPYRTPSPDSYFDTRIGFQSRSDEPTRTETTNPSAHLDPSIRTSAGAGPQTADQASMPSVIITDGGFFNPPTDSPPTATGWLTASTPPPGSWLGNSVASPSVTIPSAFLDPFTSAYLNPSVTSAYLNPSVTSAYLNPLVQTSAGANPQATDQATPPVVVTIEGSIFGASDSGGGLGTSVVYPSPSEDMATMPITLDQSAYLNPFVRTAASPEPQISNSPSPPEVITTDGGIVLPPSGTPITTRAYRPDSSAFLNSEIRITNPTIQRGPQTTVATIIPLVRSGGDFLTDAVESPAPSAFIQENVRSPSASGNAANPSAPPVVVLVNPSNGLTIFSTLKPSVPSARGESLPVESKIRHGVQPSDQGGASATVVVRPPPSLAVVGSLVTPVDTQAPMTMFIPPSVVPTTVPGSLVTSSIPGAIVTTSMPGRQITTTVAGSEVVTSVEGSIVTTSLPGSVITSSVSGFVSSVRLPGQYITTVASGPVMVFSIPAYDFTTSIPNLEIVSSVPGTVITASVRGLVVTTSVPGSIVRTIVGGSEIVSTLPGSVITTSLPGSLVTTSVAGAVVTTSLPGSETVMTLPGSLVTTSIGGSLVTTSVPGAVVTTSLPGSEVVTTLPGSLVTSSVAGSLITTSVPGAVITTSIPGNEVVTTLPGSLVTTMVSGTLVTTSVPGAVITTSLPGSEIVTTLPGSLVTTSLSGYLITTSVAGSVITTSLPGSEVVTALPGSLITTSISGRLVTTSVPGSVVTSSVPGSVIVTTLPGSLITTSVPGSVITTSLPGSVIKTTISGREILTTLPGSLITTSLPGSLITTSISGRLVTRTLSGSKIVSSVSASFVTVPATAVPGAPRARPAASSAAGPSPTARSGNRSDRNRSDRPLYPLTGAKYFVGWYLPIITAVLLRITIGMIYAAIKMMEPFYSLSDPTGAPARECLGIFYLTGNHSIDPFLAMLRGHWLVLVVSLLYLSANFMPPLASELISFHEFTNSLGVKGPEMRVNPVVGRILQGMLALTAALLVGLWGMQRRHRSGIYADPSSIATMASLLHHPEVVDDFRAVPPNASRREMEECLADKRYTLATYRGDDGRDRYGLVPVRAGVVMTRAAPPGPFGFRRATAAYARVHGGDSASERSTNSSERGPPLLAQEQQQQRQAPRRRRRNPGQARNRGRIVRDVLFVLLACGILIIILYYYFVGKDSGFERFMDSESFGPRFVMSLAGTLVHSEWKRVERELCIIEPFRALARGHAHPESSILAERTLSPVTTLGMALWRRQYTLTLAAAMALAAEALLIALTAIPFSKGTLHRAFVISAWVSVAILVSMLAALAAVYLRRPRDPPLPRAPDTIAATLSYLCGSSARLLPDFAELARLDGAARRRWVVGMRRTYVLSCEPGPDGVVRWSIDYDSPMPGNMI